MRTRRSKSVRGRQSAPATRAARKRHDGVEDRSANVVMVAAKRLARRRTALNDAHARRRIDEVERVGTGLGHSRVVGDLGLQEGLDGSVGFGVFWRGRSYRNGAGALAMADLVIRDVV